MNELTPREEEILALIARGLSNQEIADALVVSERTVRTHVGNIMSKLYLSSRTQLALRFWGLLPDYAQQEGANDAGSGHGL